MGRKPKDPPSSETHDNEILDKLCLSCNVGIYRTHHQFPDKYVKCGTCGHTKEAKIKLTKILDLNKRGEGKD